MTQKTHRFALAAIVGLGTTLTAQAADTAWQYDGGETETTPATLFAQDVGGPSLTLSCSDKVGVRATLFLEGADGDITPAPKRTRSRNIEMSTASTTAKDANWAYSRPSKTLISTKSWQGKRLFNSVIKGETVNLDISRVGLYTLTLPPVNDDFKAFAASCDATKPS